MNIPKAIEILGDTCWDYIPEHETDIRDAIKLGREALKEIGNIRQWSPEYGKSLLPGEDKE